MKFKAVWIAVLATMLMLPVHVVTAGDIEPAVAQQRNANDRHWDFDEGVNYEKDTPGLGYGFSYRHKHGIASVYVYSGGQTWTDGVSDPKLAMEFKGVEEAIKFYAASGKYANLKMDPSVERVIGGVPFVTSQASFSVDGVQHSSLTYLTVKDGLLVKYRISMRGGASTVRELADTFVANDIGQRGKNSIPQSM